MCSIRAFTLVFVMSAVVIPAAWAQPAMEEMQRSAAEWEEWMTAMAEHIADVRFDEGDVQSFLTYWESFTNLDDPEMEGEDDWDKLKDLDWILGNSTYRSWAAEQGLNGEDWLLKSMRIQMLVMRQQMSQASAIMQEQIPQQMAMIEEQCKNVEPEMCEQMKAAMAGSMAMYEGMSKGFEKLADPTEQEAAALAQYQSELMSLMMAGEEEEDW